MKIRKATKKDLKGIAEILKQEFSTPPYKDKWTSQTALKAVKYYYKIKSNIYLATLDKQIIGFLIARDEPQDKGILVPIDYFAVKKQFRKKGAGILLLQKLEDDSRKKKAKAIYFSAVKEASAIKFYKKLGYIENKKLLQMGKKLK